MDPNTSLGICTMVYTIIGSAVAVYSSFDIWRENYALVAIPKTIFTVIVWPILLGQVLYSCIREHDREIAAIKAANQSIKGIQKPANVYECSIPECRPLDIF